MELLVKFFQGVEGKERATGKKFTYDAFGVQCNKMTVYFKPKGRTAWDLFLQAIAEKKDLYVQSEKAVYVSEDGVEKEYESLFVLYDEEKIPVNAIDSFGKKLILKALKS